MSRLFITLSFLLTLVCARNAFSLEVDPCVTEKGKFKTAADAMRGQTDNVVGKFAAWNANPDSMPDSVLNEYRNAVKDYAFGIWKESPTGKGVIQSWGQLDEAAAKAKFIQFVYDKEISSDLEKKLAQAVFQKDYKEHLQSKLADLKVTVNKDIADNKAKLDQQCSPTVFGQFLRVTLGNAMIMVNGNFDASKNESGDVAKAVRAMSGISITDILKNGVQGGPDSEVSKFNNMIDGVLEKNGLGKSTVAGQILNTINPTKWSVSLPPAPKLKLDDNSLKNLGTNLSGGLIH